ncbi:YncE family protein [Ponticoccus litoralis]|uniref:YncE family protein n=1 Tax=Ponticoccus litoralis TaxID=422297 RepID=A0AAW9SE85_9RHOB
MTQKILSGRWTRGVALSALMIAAAGAVAAEPFAGLGAFDGRIGASGPDRGPIVAGGQAMIRGPRPCAEPARHPAAGRRGAGGLALHRRCRGRPSGAGHHPRGRRARRLPGGGGAWRRGPLCHGHGAEGLCRARYRVNAGAYDLEVAKVATRPYQVAVGEGALFVTSAVGRPPVRESELVKLDPATLKVIARTAPEAAPARQDGSDGGLFAVYGLGVAPGQVWVTNTRQDTVAVYASDDLSLLKQFEPGTVGHPRDAVHHDGKVYVTATFEPTVHVFDTESLEELEPIALSSSRRGQDFTTASLSLAAEAGKLFVASLRSEEVAVIDLATGEETAVWPVDGSKGTIGLAASPDGSRVYTVAQGNDMVSVLDGTTGAVLRQVNVGASPLNAVVDPATGHVYVAVRGGNAVAVLDAEGALIANLEVGATPNHLTTDGAGHVFVVDQGTGSLTRVAAQ